MNLNRETKVHAINFYLKKNDACTSPSKKACENAPASAFPVACWSGAEIPSPGLRGERANYNKWYKYLTFRRFPVPLQSR